ncbi:uncharacterized protein BDW43DRAFT_152040 [Aspergillus alliaceus]|uniref:uncharacterized protein n=1 Tax=Petromyces alliaceus TaxID=209559 RepID=UPI0012A5F11A|nr:uncharacterized protein BDW43DRAFT_152040 [Aspergillus alliaceus]KAB8238031.1 hypothetical protein BDW43DRAFT_152040 [Aspergillus alliaceus]
MGWTLCCVTRKRRCLRSGQRCRIVPRCRQRQLLLPTTFYPLHLDSHLSSDVTGLLLSGFLPYTLTLCTLLIISILLITDGPYLAAVMI